MPYKHRSSGNLIHLADCQQGIKVSDLQTMESRPALPEEVSGDYATNRHTRRKLRKLCGIEAKRMCDLGKGE
ncbi:hypothetical protein L7750_12040 [Xenorhabdus bovienii]|uniref:hypothetical protein n=1 Tax=Xenorhabdus bovienii TaxID=40576 RepID=UPI001EE0183F|nr:hypothetical protein [Xenorhabdus bovienii]MCG3471098.1 hypothetical protein [Xenorhabdus bovienii]